MSECFRLPSEKKAKKWKPSFFFGQDKMPPMSDRDVEKSKHRQRVELQQKANLMAEQTLRRLQIRKRLAKEGLIDVGKAESDNHVDVNVCVRGILRRKRRRV